MTTDTYSLPRFEDRLWHELAQLHADPGHPGRQPHHRRGRYAAALVALAAASVAVLALVTDDSGPTTKAGPGATSTVPETSPPATEPLVDSSATSSELPDAVVVVEQRNRDGRIDYQFIDETTGLRRMASTDAAGNVVYESAWLTLETGANGLAMTGISVDHEARTYSDQQMSTGAGGPPVRDNWREADSIRAALDQGNLAEDGTEVIDGRELLRLIDPSGLSDGVTWVEPSTYRPVQISGYPGSDVSYVQTFQFLERTPENLALTELQVPDGYTKT